MTFDKADVVGRINLFCHPIVALISLSIEVIANQDTLKGVVINLGIVAIEDEDKCLATNFTQTAVVRRAVVVSFIRGTAIQ